MMYVPFMEANHLDLVLIKFIFPRNYS